MFSLSYIKYNLANKKETTIKRPKQILLSLCGKTPQILTETLYCMMVQPQEPTMLDEIWLVTTTSGKEAVCQQLLDKESGKFYSFCREYDIDADAIAFDESHILAPGDLSDILNVHDNESFANVLTEKVWELTQTQNTVLHCSIAGGRKTMSAYLAMIMQFFARPQDRLFHILTGSTDFENNAEFFYPPKTPTDIKTRDGRTINTKDAGLALVDIPFIRLREKIKEFTERPFSFSDMVKYAQIWLSTPQEFPQLIIDSRSNKIHIGNSYTIKLPRMQRCIYQFIASFSANRDDGIPVWDYKKYFLPGGFSISAEHEKAFLNLYGVKDYKFGWESIQNGISRINKHLGEALDGLTTAEYYCIHTLGDYRNKFYGLKLDKEFITIL